MCYSLPCYLRPKHLSVIDTSKAFKSGWGSVNNTFLKILGSGGMASPRANIPAPLCGSEVLYLLHGRLYWEVNDVTPGLSETWSDQ